MATNGGFLDPNVVLPPRAPQNGAAAAEDPMEEDVPTQVETQVRPLGPSECIVIHWARLENRKMNQNRNLKVSLKRPMSITGVLCFQHVLT
jgi:hypothetical protein